MTYTVQKRLSAITQYTQEGTLKNVALHMGIHHITLFRWVHWYSNLLAQKRPPVYQRPWNRLPKHMEHLIVQIKEQTPAITLRSTQQILQKRGIRISIKGIYNVWKRYNYVHNSFEDIFSPYGITTIENERICNQVNILLTKDQNPSTLRYVARSINDLPTFPALHASILRLIPEQYLSLRRRLDRLDACFLITPKPILLKKARSLRQAFEKKNYRYSAVLAGILELLALHWMRTPRKELELNELLRSYIGASRNPRFNLVFQFLAGTAYSEMLDVRNARICVTRCKRLLRSVKHPRIDILVGDLYTFVSDYRQALHHYYRALAMIVDDTTHYEIRAKTALAAVIAGDYEAVQKRFLRRLKIKRNDPNFVTFALIQALFYLGQGQLNTAAEYLHQCLERSEQEQLRNYIYTTAMSFAAINHALNRHAEAHTILEKYLPLMKKYNVLRERLSLEILLQKRSIPKRVKSFPIFRLLSLLIKAHTCNRLSYYTKAQHYAAKTGLINVLHRLLLFFPNPVIQLLDKGIKPDLPGSFLKLPVFNRSLPVFHVKFLGNLVIYRNQRYFKVSLTPKQSAFLIAWAFRFNAPGKVLPTSELFRVFWPRARHPHHRLTRMLMQIRRIMNIPKHCIATIEQQEAKRLVNRGIYITTDYNDMTRAFSEARVFCRMNEHVLARDKYREAFRLLRGAPCTRMYDEWSDQTRRVILNKIETELDAFLALGTHIAPRSMKRRIQKRIRRIIASA